MCGGEKVEPKGKQQVTNLEAKHNLNSTQINSIQINWDLR